MARYCPLRDGPELYLDCKECDEKVCEQTTTQTVKAKTDTKDEKHQQEESKGE